LHILVTNDDGVAAPGLLALANAMRPLGEVSVLAPDRNWSGGGHVKTMDRPLRARAVRLADGTAGWSSDGAPSDCVALALMGFLPSTPAAKVDLVVSGINPTANLGHDVTYSGTVTAAMEAVIGDVPGIAFSLDSPMDGVAELDYAGAAGVARNVVQVALQNGIPAGILLNVNIPYLPAGQIKGYYLTRLGLRVYRNRLDQRQDPRGRPYYWIAGDAPTGIPEYGTDVGALADGFVSISPLQLDLTAYPAMQALGRWKFDL
jgi:5'-nucleotidase